MSCMCIEVASHKLSIKQCGPLGRGGVQVVSELAFYYNDLSSKPADVYKSSVKVVVANNEINKKRPGLALFKNNNGVSLINAASSLIMTVLAVQLSMISDMELFSSRR